ncbi:MAG: hypothetical protein MR860_05155 [Prevotella sp.]|nr:hypothetical protein [Prevotella sp.]
MNTRKQHKTNPTEITIPGRQKETKETKETKGKPKSKIIKPKHVKTT